MRWNPSTRYSIRRVPVIQANLVVLFHKYAHVRCAQFDPWRGAREGVYPQRYSTDRATKPRVKLGATRRAACLLAGGVVARSLQIHCWICSSLAPRLRPTSNAADVCVFMKIDHLALGFQRTVEREQLQKLEHELEPWIGSTSRSAICDKVW